MQCTELRKSEPTPRWSGEHAVTLSSAVVMNHPRVWADGVIQKEITFLPLERSHFHGHQNLPGVPKKRAEERRQVSCSFSVPETSLHGIHLSPYRNLRQLHHTDTDTDQSEPRVSHTSIYRFR